MKSASRQSGFTLLEMIIYIGIFSMLVGVVIAFYMTTASVREKNKVISEVELQGSQAMAQITQAIRNADGITEPTAGSTSASSLTVATTTSATNPTIIDLAGRALGMTEGTGVRTPLTTPLVTVSGLTFSNLSRANTTGVVSVQFTVTHATASARQEYQYSKTFYGSAAPRKVIQ